MSVTDRNITEELICINCPMGCRLTVALEDGAVTSVSGNLCPLGADYAKQEAVCPMRVLTSLMRARGDGKPFSVKSDRPVPRSLLFNCVAEIYKTRPIPPLACGDVVIANICGTGANIVSTQDVF